jgi:glucose/arabinose dehydrogenase
MRRLLISTFVSLAWIVPALAQDAPRGQAAAPNAAQNQDQDPSETPGDSVQSFQRSVQARLALAGFTEIQMIPTGFLVRAKDPEGRAVTLMLAPQTMEQSGGVPVPGQEDDGSSGDASDQPPTTDGKLTDAN